MASLGSLVVRVGADIADFTSDMGRAARISQQQSAAIKRSMLVAGTAIVAGLAMATKEAAAFEKAMAEVQTLMDDTSGVDAATESIKRLSIQYGMAPVEQAKALYQIISAGAADASSQMILLEASNRLAIGGVTDVATAADGLTGILNAYGLEATESSRISDVMFATMKAGKTTIGEIAANISQVTPIAATMGVAFEEVGAALATVTAITGNTAIASTQLRQAITSIGAPAEKSKKIFAELGLEFGKTAIEMKGGLLPYMQEVIEKTGGSTVKLKKLFGSVEAVNGVLALSTNNFAKFKGALDATMNSAGETDKAFEKMSKTMDFKLKQLNALFQVFKVTIGTALLPVISKMLDSMKGLGTEMDSAKKAGQFFANTLKVLVTAGIVVKNVFEAVGLVIGNFAGIVISSFGALWKSINAIIDGIGSAWTNLINGEFQAAANSMAAMNGAIVKSFTDAGDGIADAIVTIGQGIKGEFTDGVDSMIALWEDAEDAAYEVSDALDDVVDTAKSMTTPMDDVAGSITDDLEEIVVTAEKVPDSFYLAAAGTKAAGEDMKETFAGSNGVAAVIENSFKRLDDMFASFWSNLLKDGKFSLKGIKDLFLDTIASMLHAALTQPIVLRIGTMMTGGLASGGANAGGIGGLAGGIGDIGSLFSGISGALLGGAGGYAIGGTGGAIGGVLGSAFGAGIGGSLVGAFASTAFGSALAGSIGASTFAAIGTAIAPVIGTLLGIAIGSIIGKFFKSDPQIRAGGSDAFGNLKDTKFFGSALGGVNVGKTKGGLDKSVDEFGAAIVEFDDAIASFLSKNQLEKITDALSTWDSKLKGNAISIETMLNSRFAAILSTFSGTVQAYVNQFDTLESKADALQRFVIALNNVGTAIAMFADSNPAEILAESLETAATSSTEKLQAIGTGLLDMFSAFDGTPEQMQEIAQLVDARYRGELEYLQAIDQLVKGIAASIEAQQNKIREAVEGPQTFDELIAQAQELFSTISGAGSPEELAQIVNSIQSLIDRAFGGLDAGGQVAQADTLIAFLDQVQAAAEERAEALAQMVIDEGVLLREQALLFAETIGAPLDLNVQATDAVNDSINRQTDLIVDRSEQRDQLLRDLIREIRAGNELAEVRP